MLWSGGVREFALRTFGGRLGHHSSVKNLLKPIKLTKTTINEAPKYLWCASLFLNAGQLLKLGITVGEKDLALVLEQSIHGRVHQFVVFYSCVQNCMSV